MTSKLTGRNKRYVLIVYTV